MFPSYDNKKMSDRERRTREREKERKKVKTKSYCYVIIGRDEQSESSLWFKSLQMKSSF